MVAALAGKDVIIGEVGWPSEGRMREGALPSPANQARVIQDVLALAKQGNYRVNVIEAFDQPWKRALEGTVGGYWGLLDARTRDYKFIWGEAVSNHPQWKWQAAGGVVFVALIFAAAFLGRRGGVSAALWFAVTANAIAGGALIGWSIADVPRQSFDAGGLMRSVALAAIALLTPPVVSAATMRGVAMPPFWRVIGPRAGRVADPLTLAAGILLIATMLLALQSALGLVFDPRYRDFPFAPLTAAVVPFVTHHVMVKRGAGAHAASEIGGAVLLALSVPYIAINEGFANWQSLWLCAVFARWPLFWRGRATGKAEQQQSRGKRGQRNIVEHDAKAGERERRREQDQRRPQQIEQCDRERGKAEHRILKQHGDDRPRQTEPGVEAGGASQADRRLLDRQIADVERIAERAETDDEQCVGRARAGQEQFHAADYAGLRRGKQIIVAPAPRRKILPNGKWHGRH